MKVIPTIIFFLILTLTDAFAHEAEIPHEEPVPTIDPVLLAGIVVVLAIAGFVLWKFVLHAPKSSSPTQSVSPDISPTAQEKSASENNQSDNSQKSS